MKVNISPEEALNQAFVSMPQFSFLIGGLTIDDNPEIVGVVLVADPKFPAPLALVLSKEMAVLLRDNVDALIPHIEFSASVSSDEQGPKHVH